MSLTGFVTLDGVCPFMRCTGYVTYGVSRSIAVLYSVHYPKSNLNRCTTNKSVLDGADTSI